MLTVNTMLAFSNPSSDSFVMVLVLVKPFSVVVVDMVRPVSDNRISEDELESKEVE